MYIKQKYADYCATEYRLFSIQSLYILR